MPRARPTTFGKAVKRIVRAHCRLGKVTKTTSSLRKKGKVTREAPVAGRHLRNGAKVNLTVGKGPKKT